MKALYIAPYAPQGRGSFVRTGAAKKIRTLVSGLISQRFCVSLFNTANSAEKNSIPEVVIHSTSSEKWSEYFPIGLRKRKIGKALHMVMSPFYGLYLCAVVRPGLVLLYNPYITEVLIGLMLKLFDPRVVLMLQVEDLPLTRQRVGVGRVKDAIDYLALYLVISSVNIVSYVNIRMRKYSALRMVKSHSLVKMYLPGLVSDQNLTCHSINSRSVENFKLRVGYFGGLTPEKGADKLLNIIENKALIVEWHVTGGGELASQFNEVASDSSKNLNFYGLVSDADLSEIVEKVDIVVNPHTVNSRSELGILPFKIIEALANGKVVVSTPAAGLDDDLAAAVTWSVGDSVSEIEDALQRAIIEWYSRDSRAGAEVAELVKERFSSTSVAKNIKHSYVSCVESYDGRVI